ncbi:unnamed protein product [Phytomonas sp. EM1]|nr:unnamed protein product [Phytomonas sp. EM1]|eukprot:CCW62147.1 unnamed protein product [Phytomonas sp. isolate EM1]
MTFIFIHTYAQGEGSGFLANKKSSKR